MRKVLLECGKWKMYNMYEEKDTRKMYIHREKW